MKEFFEVGSCYKTKKEVYFNLHQSDYSKLVTVQPETRFLVVDLIENLDPYNQRNENFFWIECLLTTGKIHIVWFCHLCTTDISEFFEQIQ